MDALAKVLDRFQNIINGEAVPPPRQRFTSYALSNFRGGIGKTTLAFNLAYEISRVNSSLLLDLCPQRSFSDLLLGEALDSVEENIYDALIPKVQAGNEEPNYSNLLLPVSMTCPSFKKSKTWMMPGSADLFLFPSSLYTALNQNAAGSDERRVKASTNKILNAITDIIGQAKKIQPVDRVLIDTSPFFAGATHLAWTSVQALIIPVRVDQQSVDALDLTLKMLAVPEMDFLRINARADRQHVPRVHAIAMTHCGWSREQTSTPDRSTQTFVSKVLGIVEKYADLFSYDDPTEAIFLMDDFHAAGRISGAKRLPLSKLTKGQFVAIDGRRLQVNESLDRYQKEIKALASVL